MIVTTHNAQIMPLRSSSSPSQGSWQVICGTCGLEARPMNLYVSGNAGLFGLEAARDPKLEAPFS